MDIPSANRDVGQHGFLSCIKPYDNIWKSGSWSFQAIKTEQCCTGFDHVAHGLVKIGCHMFQRFGKIDALLNVVCPSFIYEQTHKSYGPLLIILYYIILYYIVLYYIYIFYYIKYYNISYCIILYHMILYHIISYHII